MPEALKNPMLAIRITAPSGHASFDFVNILKNTPCEFSTCLDVKSNVTCVYSSIVFGCNTVDFFMCLLMDDIVVWCIVNVGLCDDQILRDVKSDMWSNDAAFNAYNKYLLAIGSASIEDLLDDDDRGGNVNIM